MNIRRIIIFRFVICQYHPINRWIILTRQQPHFEEVREMSEIWDYIYYFFHHSIIRLSFAGTPA